MADHDDGRPSIYDHIARHLPEIGPGLAGGGHTLPDEVDQDDGGLHWAPGAWDGVVTYHLAASDDDGEDGEDGEDEPNVDELIAAVRGAVESGLAAQPYTALYEQVRDGRLIQIADSLLNRLAESDVPADGLAELGTRLATTSPDRGPVKLGIALLGLVHAAADDTARQTILLALGRHEEFTLYVAVALRNSLDDPELALWALARGVDGWGRIHVVERLADTERPEIKEWILREGWRNSVANYLAHVAAGAGDLAKHLAGDDVDDELLHIASDILVGLTEGPPGPGMAAYPDGARATESFVRHMTERADGLDHVLALHAVKTYVVDEYDEEDWEELAAQGWSTELRRWIRDRCVEILDRPLWRELATERLESARSEDDLWRADQAADILGIPTLPIHLRRLRHDPVADTSWFAVMRHVDESTIDEVIDLAAEILPLTSIATGRPTLDIGFEPGPEFCLEVVIQDLDDWPGRGWQLIAAALASATIRNRTTAARVLAAWDRAIWPAEAGPALREAIAREPDDDIKDTMQRVLDGLPFDDDDDDLDFDVEEELARLEDRRNPNVD